mmetsp:Transcript_23163/g.56575  ORF Transcript_23163/g.56575 Transcript_23163/m.56575 type:complete len:213 (+) Transcript_23163:389-1027(+)
MSAAPRAKLRWPLSFSCCASSFRRSSPATSSRRRRMPDPAARSTAISTCCTCRRAPAGEQRCSRKCCSWPPSTASKASGGRCSCASRARCCSTTCGRPTIPRATRCSLRSSTTVCSRSCQRSIRAASSTATRASPTGACFSWKKRATCRRSPRCFRTSSRTRQSMAPTCTAATCWRALREMDSCAPSTTLSLPCFPELRLASTTRCAHSSTC